MKDSNLQVFAGKFLDIAKKLRDDHTIHNPVNYKRFMIDTKRVGLADGDAMFCSEVLSNFYEEAKWSRKYSEVYANEILRGVVIELYKNRDLPKAQSALKKRLTDFDSYSEEHLVLLYLAGIASNIPSLSVGRINIVKLDREQVAKRLRQTAMMQPGQAMLQSLPGKVLSEFVCIAEPLRAKEMAVEETRRALEVLRYAIPFIYEDVYKDLRVNVGIVGYYSEGDFISYVLPTGENLSITATFDHNRPFAAFPISSDSIKVMHDCGAMMIAKLLERPIDELGEIDRVLLRGTHWFGNALCQDEPENELLSLITCLETFLTPKDGNPIGTAIAEAIALLLEEDLDERKNLKKRVKQLYGKRSAVSHGGEKAVLISDLVDLRQIAKRLIYCLVNLRPQLNSQKDLLDLIENKKLG